MVVAREEIFGPVVVVIPFDEEEEGVAIANDSEFGLYDYVFSGDSPKAFRVARQLRAGHVGVNTAQRHHEAPFGGFKMSGVGRDGGDLRPRGVLGDAGDHLVELTETSRYRRPTQAEKGEQREHIRPRHHGRNRGRRNGVGAPARRRGGQRRAGGQDRLRRPG